MKTFIKYFFFLCIFLTLSCEGKSRTAKCDKEMLFKVKIENQKKFKIYEDLKRKAKDYNVIIDRPIRQFNDTLLFRTQNCMKRNIVKLLERRDINFYEIEDLSIPRVTRRNLKRLTKQSKISYDVINSRYLDGEEINNYVYSLAQHIGNMHSRLDVRFNIEGYSYEKRPINSIFIGYRNRPNPIVLIDAGIHAREWHSRNIALNILYQLGKEADLGVNGILYNVSFLVVPNLNPDGYEYSYYHELLWRKNRRPVQNNCYGVDCNRNYDIEWSYGENEKDPCGYIYKGPEPFSEPETQIMRNIMTQINKECLMYISIHTFGNKILYPSGYTTQAHPKSESLSKVANAGARAVLRRTGTNFTVSQSGTGLYLAAGGSDDYAMDVLGIPLAYTFESGKEQFGFIVPERELKKTILEGWVAIKAMIKEAYRFKDRRTMKRKNAKNNE